MLVLKWWLLVIFIIVGGLLAKTPLPTQAFTLNAYFKVIALASKKRDIWRKIFLGRDLGFVASPWLFKDRVKPPFVPILKSFPKYPTEGHYRNERTGPSSSHFTFPQLYSHLKLSPRLPPPVRRRQNHARSYNAFSTNQNASRYYRRYPAYPDGG